MSARAAGPAGGPVLEVRDLEVGIQPLARRKGTELTLVSGVSFSVYAGEILGVVGESGSGKSISGLAVIGLLPARARVRGSIVFNGRQLVGLSEADLARIRGRDIGMVFQQPATALDPVFSIGDQVAETLRRHKGLSRQRARAKAVETLSSVGIPDAARRYRAHPHELSGGLRQRAMIAVALACEPALIIADEPTTALDVTIQAQIIELLKQIATERDTAVVLITHDFGVVAEACARVVTMYAGETVEVGPVDALLESPQHPYTSALLRSIPGPATRGSAIPALPGTVPAPGSWPSGCHFAPRCESATEVCSDPPALVETEPGGRQSRCWRHDELTLRGAL